MNKFALLRHARILAPVAAAVGSAAANAEAIDVGAVVSDIAAQAGPIGLIGGAVLLITVAVVAFRWVRSALR